MKIWPPKPSTPSSPAWARERAGSTALRFAKSYPVVLLARKPESYNDIVAEIRQSGGQAIGIATDTGSAESVAAAFGAIQKELPDRKLAAAIYNVGSGFVVKPFLETTPEDLELSLKRQPVGLRDCRPSRSLAAAV